MTFAELCENYIIFAKLKLKPQSIRSINSRLSAYIMPYFKNFIVNEITPIDYLKWQQLIQKYNLSYSYKRALHYTIVALLNFYKTFYDQSYNNIASLVGNFKKEESSRITEVWSLDEYRKFIKNVDDVVYRVLFRFLYFSGCRIGETLALTFNDFNNNMISINKTISKEFINGERAITTPKTKKSIRNIPIDSETVNAINQLKRYYITRYGSYDNNFYIFGGLDPLSQSTVERKKNYYCKLASVKQIKLHEFRHSHASLLLSEGIPITAIAERLGHSDISLTFNTYSHIMPKDEKRVIKLLNSIC